MKQLKRAYFRISHSLTNLGHGIYDPSYMTYYELVSR